VTEAGLDQGRARSAEDLPQPARSVPAAEPAPLGSGEQMPRPGRPRSERSRTAILRAASEMLLEQGLGEISMDAVAERAGASKATIYRWWPSKELLALDALLSRWEPAPPNDAPAGSLAEDLMALIAPWARQLQEKSYGRLIAAFINRVQSDPAFAAEYRTRFVEPRRDRARAIFAHAIECGEIPSKTDVEAAVDLLYGPFYHRMLHGHAALSDAFTCTIVRSVVAAVGGPTR
jgi:AcrR family transcriptional regulator